MALLRAYVTALHTVELDEITGPRPGTLYYAFDSSTASYWAIAWFDPSTHATQRTQVALQDGMAGAVFTRHSGTGRWRASVHERGSLPCPGELPPAVLQAWGITPHPCTIN
jgi:hypothetical protein